MAGCLLPRGCAHRSKPRFLQEDADDLASHWGPVELEYHEDAFDEEYSEGGTYYVNTPEEDW